jgi:hypothetical protein
LNIVVGFEEGLFGRKERVKLIVSAR